MAFEVELHLKGKARMQKILETYYKKSVDHIWYVVPNKLMGEKILQLARNLEHDKSPTWILYSVINDLKDDPKKATIYFDNGKISLEKLCGIDTTARAHSLAHSVST